MRMLNSFRRSLLELQCRRPHRLSATWFVAGTCAERRIECIDMPAPQIIGVVGKVPEEALSVLGGPQAMVLRSGDGGPRWEAQAEA